MDEQTIRGQFEDPTLGAFHYEGSWQLIGNGATWQAFIWSRKGALASSPGGVLIDARAIDIEKYVKSQIEKTIQRATRMSRDMHTGAP